MAGIGQGAALIKLEGARQPLEEKIALAHGLLGNAVQRIEDDPFPAIGSGEKFADLPGHVWRVMIRALRCAARGQGIERPASGWATGPAA